MALKSLTRIAAGAATLGIAGLSLTMSVPASAITKPEPGGSVSPEPAPLSADTGGNLDLTQFGAGTLGGIAVTGAAFAAAARLRRHKQSGNPPEVHAHP